MSPAPAPGDGPISRADIEAKLREIRGEVESVGDTAKPYVLVAAVSGALLLFGTAYLLGRRRGRKKTTIVEVRRV